ncbi:MAG TPA: mannitol-1-phosphate 5-dehydrogenase [Sphaerochaeta sp.]|nr:mannitol-1-phosphate 5-dehydrogenase [Sphaerochaeta sp.]
MKPNLVQWGAGNIGRSFIGQVFAQNGYSVTFIDINADLIEVLNLNHSYDVHTVSGEKSEILVVDDVSAINAMNQDAVDEAITHASLMGVSVGKNVWPHIASSLSKAILTRYKIRPLKPLDIILAENIHHASQFVTALLKQYLPKDFPFHSYVGLIETSIGKMVPIQEGDALGSVRAEPYDELIVDKDGFLQDIPRVAQLHPVSPIGAYVDRKLFIHNLGHATSAYLGFKANPNAIHISDVLEDSAVFNKVKTTMQQSSDVLLELYPEVFTERALAEHIDDLLNRFRNKALQDTVFRVGRDLRRKLRYDDRFMGILIEAQRLHKSWDSIGKAYLAALSFYATDINHDQMPSDKECLQQMEHMNLKEKLYYISEWEHSHLSQGLFEEIYEGFLRIRSESL